MNRWIYFFSIYDLKQISLKEGIEDSSMVWATSESADAVLRMIHGLHGKKTGTGNEKDSRFIGLIQKKGGWK
jgi:hypothetical protein